MLPSLSPAHISYHLSNLSRQSAFSRKFSSGLGWNTWLGDLKDPLSLAEFKTLGLLVTQHGGRDGWGVRVFHSKN